jgi:hypothetical protein
MWRLTLSGKDDLYLGITGSGMWTSVVAVAWSATDRATSMSEAFTNTSSDTTLAHGCSTCSSDMARRMRDRWSRWKTWSRVREAYLRRWFYRNVEHCRNNVGARLQHRLISHSDGEIEAGWRHGMRMFLQKEGTMMEGSFCYYFFIFVLAGSFL